MAGLTVRPAVSPGDIEESIRFPFALYPGYPHWVPPLLVERRDFLNPRKNPVYEYAEVQPLVARRGATVVGTITGLTNPRFGEFHPREGHIGFFGLYECERDAEASHGLFTAAAEWLKVRGLSVMRGPSNLTTNDVVGLLVEGFEEDPAILMPYNPPYYAEQFDAFGLSKVKDLFALEVRAEEYKGQLDKLASKLLLRGRITVRPVNLRRWNQELAFVRDCYNKAWAHNWGFVPWTDRELAVLAKQVKPLIDPTPRPGGRDRRRASRDPDRGAGRQRGAQAGAWTALPVRPDQDPMAAQGDGMPAGTGPGTRRTAEIPAARAGWAAHPARFRAASRSATGAPRWDGSWRTMRRSCGRSYISMPVEPRSTASTTGRCRVGSSGLRRRPMARRWGGHAGGRATRRQRR